MNTYLVPIKDLANYDCNYITPIYADSSEDAYLIAAYKFKDRIVIRQDEYENYESILNLPNLFPIELKSDIIKEAIKESITQSNSEDNTNMAFFNVNWNNYTEELSSIAAQESWSNDTYPNNGILANYLNHTYEKLTSEKNIVIGSDYALFNTGLFTKYYEPIYTYQSGKDINFLTSYELSSIGIAERPERANYFDHPDLLLFDWHYPIDIKYKHILEDENNQKRLPKGFLEKENKLSILTGAVDLMKKRVSSNYKIAIPQHYDGKIQLLLPLCLDSDNGKPNLALAVTKKKNCYQGHTCLTLDMAYNNARLIAKPESNWLSQ